LGLRPERQGLRPSPFLDSLTIAELRPLASGCSQVPTSNATWEVEQWVDLLGAEAAERRVHDAGYQDLNALASALGHRDRSRTDPAAHPWVSQVAEIPGSLTGYVESLCDFTEPFPAPWQNAIFGLVRPVVRRAWQEELSKDFDELPMHARSVLRALARRPPERLVRLMTGAVVVLMHYRNAVSPPPVGVVDFIHETGPDGDWVFQAFPSLGRLISTRCTLWVRASIEIAKACSQDVPQLTALLGGAPGEVISVTPFLGDDHAGGRSVCKITFEAGGVAFKPRDTPLTESLRALADEIAGITGTDVPLLLPESKVVGDHEWSRWVEHAESKAVSRGSFSFRLGQTSALLWLTGATDIHSDNLVASADGPILVDSETVLTPRLPAASNGADPAGFSALAESPLGVLILPVTVNGPLGSYDPTVIGDGASEVMGQGWVWTNPGQSSMFLERVELTREHTNVALPRSAEGQRWRLDNDAFLEGFELLLLAVSNRRPFVLREGGPWDRLTYSSFRVLVRPTSLYSELLAGGLHPTLLTKMSSRERFFDQLRVAAVAEAAFWPVVDAEIAAVLRGDFPYFQGRGDSRDLLDEDGAPVAVDLFEASAREVSESRIARLEPPAIVRAVWVAHAALETASFNTDGAFPSADCCITPRSALRDVHLEAAQLLRDRLLTLDFSSNGETPLWLEARSDRGQAWRVQPAGFGLYSGSLGIALALAAWSRLTEDDRATSKAELVYAHIKSHRLWLGDQGLGAYQGLSSNIRGLAALARLLGHVDDLPELFKAGVEALRDVGQAEGPTDVMSGSAGAVLVLADIVGHEACCSATSALAHELIVSRATSLADAVTRLGSGSDAVWPSDATHRLPLVGFAHGNSGRALALLKADQTCSTTRFRPLVEAALRAERRERRPLGGWNDLRPFAASESTGTWCNGSVGTGIARALMADAIGPRPDLLEDLVHAWRHASDGRSTLGKGQSLCHGDLGAFELGVRCREYLPNVGDGPEEVLGMVASSVASRRGVGIAGYGGLGDLPGLMNGSAGILLSLVRGLRPDLVRSPLEGGLF